jgi:membrane associated rhomboid family serine protease
MILFCRRRRSSTTAVGGSGYFALLLLVNAIIVVDVVLTSVVVVVSGSSTPLPSARNNHLKSWSVVSSSNGNNDNTATSNNIHSILTRGQSIFTNALRGGLRGGGAAASAVAARKSKFSSGNSSDSSKHHGLLWRDDWNGSKINIHAKQIIRQKRNQLEKVQHNAVRQLRNTVRLKQQQLHNSIYDFNSKLDNTFPHPPYSIWRQQYKDTHQTQGKTTLTGNIFLLNIAIFGLQTLYPQLTALGAKRSDLILNGRQLHRLITPIFLHGGVGHLIANSYSLKSMGMNVERTFGQRRLFATYMVSGITGNILSALQSPKPAVGASGAIFGLVGAYYTFLSRNQNLLPYNAEYQKTALLETIGLNIILGMTNPMIDNWGHLGGFIGGVGMSYLIGPKLYIARVPPSPLLSSSSSSSSSSLGILSSSKIVIDRPMLVLRSPEYLIDGISRLTDNVSMFGRNVKAGLSTYLNNNENKVQEYYYDGIVDNIQHIVDDTSTGGGGGVCGGDGTIYRVLKENDAILTGSNNINRDNSLRTQQREGGRKRMKTPREGRSIRPKYSHMY